MEKNLNDAMNKAKNIKLTIFDVDGVLTDGKIYFTNSGTEYKAFHTQDGLGIKMLLRAGIEVAIITARQSGLVQKRMDELGVKYVFQGQENKLLSYELIKKELVLKDEEIAYTGDDLNDLALIRRCGLGIAVANATHLVQQHAHWQTQKSGGSGAVREICEFILHAQNSLHSVYETYF